VLYEQYPGLAIIRPARTVSCPSITLDQYCEQNNITGVDAIKLDTQGSELDILKAATQILKTVSLIDIEVEFNELYEEQPLFGDVDCFLRSQGFVLWRVNNLAHYSKGLVEGANSGILIASDPGSFQTIEQDNGQLFWGQAHYVRRDFVPMETEAELDAEQALRAAILVGQYGHWDLSLEILRKSGDRKLFDLLASIIRPCGPQVPLRDQLTVAHADIAELRRINGELQAARIAEEVAQRRNDAMTDEERVRQARERKRRLLSFGPHAVAVLAATKHGVFSVDPEDNYVSRALLHDGCYGEDEYLLAKSLISRGGDVLVIGAHIGALAIPLSRHCRRLVAIEANPRTYKHLERNIALNGCHNITSYNIAANDKPGTIKFLMNTENSGGSKRMPASLQPGYICDDPEITEIDAVPLDTLLEKREFELILMDIEGSEYFALKGMQRILERSQALSVEFLPHALAFVAAVAVDDFSATILSHFDCMYVPADHGIVPQHAILDTLRNMYQAGQEHAGLYFLKESMIGAAGLPCDGHTAPNT
jgi:FkbM family methyltransferase